MAGVPGPEPVADVGDLAPFDGAVDADWLAAAKAFHHEVIGLPVHGAEEPSAVPHYHGPAPPREVRSKDGGDFNVLEAAPSLPQQLCKTGREGYRVLPEVFRAVVLFREPGQLYLQFPGHPRPATSW